MFTLMVQVTRPRWPQRPYMVKTFKIFSKTVRSKILKLGMERNVLKFHKVYMNGYPELTYLFYGNVKFGETCFFVLRISPDIRRAFTGPLVFWFYELYNTFNAILAIASSFGANSPAQYTHPNPSPPIGPLTRTPRPNPIFFFNLSFIT